MTWIDMHMQQQRAVSAPVVSPDGSRIVYAISDPDWKTGSRQSDIYLASVGEGVKSTRRLTSTPDKNESQPRWTADGQRIFFVSNRDAKAAGAAANQLYVMSTDGGDVRKVTEVPDHLSLRHPRGLCGGRERRRILDDCESASSRPPAGCGFSVVRETAPSASPIRRSVQRLEGGQLRSEALSPFVPRALLPGLR